MDLQQPDLTAIGSSVLAKRYLARNEQGELIETPQERFVAVAKHVAQAEAAYDINPETVWPVFYKMMAARDFMPNTPCLVNAGHPNGQLSACFVLPIEDSMERIFQTLKDTALIHKSGGGVGSSFSRIRPANDFVQTTTGLASGPISFMHAYNNVTECVKQSGVRRGANMAVLRCLDGATMIHTVSGRFPIKDLVGQRPYVYTCDAATRRVHVIRADQVFASDKNREMVRVWFDNDEYIDCTIDQRFLLASGRYKEAKDLKLGMRLMALTKTVIKHGNSSRYIKTVGCTDGRNEYEHRVIARDILKETTTADWHVHHLDGNSLNNVPSNLEMINRSDHASVHLQPLLYHQRRIAKKRRGKTLEEVYGKEKAAEWKSRMSVSAQNRAHAKPGNHKVVRVEPIKDKADVVYDISLPTLHNFAANGVFVHNCDHPDILQFVDCKLKPGDLNNFNISVGITNAFMQALDEDTEYPLINPRTGKPTRTVRAREVFNRIVHNAHFSGEPGLFFLDRVNESDPVATPDDPIEAPNPCQPGWATVLTPEGIRTFDEVHVGSTIWSGQRWTQITNKVKTGVKPVYRYHTRAGCFVGTSNHRIVSEGTKIEIVDTSNVDLALGQLGDPNDKISPQDIVDGLVIGNGITQANSGAPFLTISEDDVCCYRKSEIAELILEHCPTVHDDAWRVATTINEVSTNVFERIVPARFLYGTAQKMRGFLRGLYTANGSTHRNRITLLTNVNIVRNVQMMLSSLGIPSHYTINRAHGCVYYYLNIEAWACKRFHNLIGFIQPEHGFIQPEHNHCLDVVCNIRPKLTYDIVDVEYFGEETVYAITVDDEEHTYWTGGLHASNCGEQPLHPYDACDLGSINLANFLSAGKIDWDRLGSTTRTAVRFLDDVHDVNHYPIPEIQKRTQNNRRIGLGVMGWADVLIDMGIPYASQKALDLAELVMAFINIAAIKASEELATHRGPFPVFASSKHATNGKKPRRNATVTTIAPTGSISIIAGCSSGIEPLFAVVQTRRQADMTMVDVNPRFIAVAKREGFYSETLMERVRETGTVKDCPEVPGHWQQVFAVANEIPVEYHVKMQAAFQQHVECAVSKTINLPQTAPVEDVERAYMLAWQEGCKGITVYRDKCRENQTLSLGASSEKKAEPKAELVRPELHPLPTEPYDAKVWYVETPAGKLSVKLGLDHGRPFEVWYEVSRPGRAITALSDALARLGSLVLRMDSPIDPMRRVELIIDQLTGLGGGDSVGFGPGRVLSVPDGAAKALRTLLDAVSKDEPASTVVSTPIVVVSAAEGISKPSNGHNGNGHNSNGHNGNGHNGNGHHHNLGAGDICPECHQATLYHTEGCSMCPCGFSHC